MLSIATRTEVLTYFEVLVVVDLVPRSMSDSFHFLLACLPAERAFQVDELYYLHLQICAVQLAAWLILRSRTQTTRRNVLARS